MRNIFLGAFLVVGGTFSWRQFGKADENINTSTHQSQNIFPCRGCPELPGCTNPKVFTQKNTKKSVSMKCCPIEKGDNYVKQSQ
jgi:hypothetical protein